MSTVDIAHLRSWIGRRETVADIVTPRLLREYAAMLDREDSGTAPLALHWCLAPPAAKATTLGPDGHPARGGFLPPVPLPRRMWAGGRLTLHDRLRSGDAVTRASHIADVTVKEGRTGVLCFVTVEHAITGPRGLAIAERQDIVYRPAEAAPAPPPPAPEPAQWRRDMTSGPVLLFRYAALTFNGHRIHYDRPYATEAEHYPGLVVHGPLQATWLLEFAAEIVGRPPKDFSFRGLRPLFDFQPLSLCAGTTETGLKLWVEANGAATMEATAQW
jgi:3-methylfumaryl-CoA hydratase